MTGPDDCKMQNNATEIFANGVDDTANFLCSPGKPKADGSTRTRLRALRVMVAGHPNAEFVLCRV